MSEQIDPKRAAVVAEIAGMGHAAAYDWLVDRVVELESLLKSAGEIIDVLQSPETDGCAR